MAHIDAELLTIEQDAERNRRALADSVEQIARRVRPKNLVSLAQRKVSDEAWKGFGELREAVRNERGKAAVLVAGALGAFLLGRSSQSKPTFKPREATIGASASAASVPTKAHFSLDIVSGKGAAFAQGAKKLAAAAVAVATGYAMGLAVPVTRAESDLMGDASARVKDYAAEFRRVHSRGARIAAVQSFGVAQPAAAALGLLGALAALVGDSGKSPVDRPNRV